MTRIARTSLPDGYFHVSARGVDRTTPLFGDNEDRTLFLRLLRSVVDKLDRTCHALCARNLLAPRRRLRAA